MTHSRGLDVRPGRIHSLDGLRGLAATVVLLHHALLVFPSLAAPYFNGETTRWSAAWWFVNTPMHLFWEGTAAVYVFFILSGVVLAVPVYAASGTFDWKAFYPQRLLRLYVPVWGAVLFAVGTFLIVPRNPLMESAWLQAMPSQITPDRVFKDLTLIMGNGWLASPLWSLRWEILFSVLLPLFIWAAYLVRRHTFLAIGGCLVVIGIGGFVNQDVLRFMPMFAIGVLLLPIVSSPREATRALASQPRHAGWISTLALGLLLMILPWLAPILKTSSAGAGLLIGLAAGGSSLVVICAATYPPVKRFLTYPLLLWLGRISFSLYLVHEPIVITTAHLFGPGNEYIAVPVGIMASLAVAALFFRFVEQPSYKLAKASVRVLSRSTKTFGSTRSTA
ncbi:acyltransferase [Arthrobacter sp. zg-Y859]|uniref:Acyltransferase n=1 Tax=Arthrobacter jinronghuae TaxID=2964609 RepID=A0ABT1NTM4_9MICC|nr:acyltransferase [Arthrobacter jinronghuae]MCQ1951082.1 acyltransferase [Arthrobacter jinronghuae]UWX79533.1 acyltransferase [Arthrobacter jinronghuae]